MNYPLAIAISLIVAALWEYAAGLYSWIRRRQYLHEVVVQRIAEFKQEVEAYEREGHTPQEVIRFAEELEAKYLGYSA